MSWHPDMPLEYRNQIVTGDAREMAPRIPDESVDLIFTDPVYNRIEDYRWLAKMSARVLKTNRRCMALCGHYHLPAIMSYMSDHLTWAWLIAQIQGHLTAPIFQERVWASWKPCVVFKKGVVRHYANFAMDCFRDTPVALAYSKRFHKWGQGAPFFAYYIERWTSLDAIIGDPFVGGGTIPAVCKVLGRNYIAFEIDPDIAKLARQRVANTQPPLFVPEPEQLALSIPV